MSNYLKKLTLLGAVVVTLLCASSAEAAITLKISTDGGVNFTTFTGAENAGIVMGSVSFTDGITGAVIDVSATATTNQPGNFPTARVSQTNVSVNNTNPAAIGLLALVIRVSDTDFIQPGASPLPNALFSSSLSGTVGNSNSGVVLSGLLADASFQSAADYSNTKFGGLPGVITPGPGDTLTQNFLVPAVGFGATGNFGNTQQAVVNVDATPFALSNEFRFTGLSIGAGASIELTGVTTLASVPAPPAAILALTALPFLGVSWLRRRKAVVKVG